MSKGTISPVPSLHSRDSAEKLTSDALGGHLLPLDGLRGVFVTAVVMFHAGLKGAGGFYLGVDGFFVLSGFLITSLLIRDFKVFGGIQFKNFWLRRAKRLLPALFFLVLVVAIGEALFGDAALMPTIRGDCLATLFYVSNWYYIATHVGYFGTTVLKSPLQHTWTLAIEEQFYIVWPITIALLYRIFKKNFKWLLLVAFVLSMVSAVSMFLVYNHGSNLNGAYYGTETRAQALLLGASLAFLFSLLSEFPRFIKSTVGLIGPYAWIPALVIALIASGPVSWMFYGGFYIFDISITIVIAYVVFFPHRVFSNLFTVSPLVFLGKISYGLYLWQYPIVLIVNQARTGFSGIFLFLIQTVLALLLSICSYYFLEKPVRYSSYFKKAKAWSVAAPVIVSVVIISVVVGTLTPATKSFAAVSISQKQLTASLKADPIRVLLVGDSVAVTMGFGLAAVENEYGVKLYDQGLVGCGTLIHGLIREDANLPAAPQTGIGVNCSQWPEIYSGYVQKYKPDVVILTAGRWEVLDRNWGNGWEHVGDPYFDQRLVASLEKAVKVLGTEGIPVIFTTSPYFDSINPNTGIVEDSSQPSRVQAYNSIVNKVAAMYKGHVFVYNLNKVIDPNNQYSEYIDGVEIRWTDGIHITEPQGGEYIAQTLLPYAVKIGLSYRQKTVVSK